jgi:hypothetical protein
LFNLFFSLSGECVCIHFFWLLYDLNIHNHYLLRCDWEILDHLWGTALKQSQKSKPFSEFCVPPVAIFMIHFTQNLLAIMSVIAVIIMYRPVCEISHKSSEILKHCHSQIFWSTLWIS